MVGGIKSGERGCQVPTVDDHRSVKSRRRAALHNNRRPDNQRCSPARDRACVGGSCSVPYGVRDRKCSDDRHGYSYLIIKAQVGVPSYNMFPAVEKIDWLNTM